MIIEDCKNLERIDLDYSDPGKIYLESLPNLRYLRINIYDLEDKSSFIKQLGELTSLEYLLMEIGKIDTLDLSPLRNLKAVHFHRSKVPLILNKSLKDEIILNSYKGTVQYVEQ